jgi:hypothetical protein
MAARSHIDLPTMSKHTRRHPAWLRKPVAHRDQEWLSVELKSKLQGTDDRRAHVGLAMRQMDCFARPAFCPRLSGRPAKNSPQLVGRGKHTLTISWH